MPNSSSQTRHRAKYAGQHMRVLVRIEMGGPDTRGQNFFDLRAQFGIDINRLPASA